jgi:uncharacterized membrane protein YsdA (DUF1294 family)
MSPPPAPQPFRYRHGSRLGVSAVVLLCLLLVLPAFALSQLATRIDWRVLIAVPLALSGFTFLAYRKDKRRAEAGEWRIPESTLHFVGLIGGWPGAYLAQRTFRHKTSKTSFQVVFWIIVVAHQFVAADSLFRWRLTKAAVEFVGSQKT